MASNGLVQRAFATSSVRPEALNVTPDLLGMPLAPHGRRALAMGVDVAVIGLLSTTGMFWVVAGIGALVVQLRRPPRHRPRARAALMWIALLVLCVLAVQRGVQWAEHRDDPPGAAAADVDVDDDDAPALAVPAAASSSVDVATLDAETQHAHDAARIRDLEGPGRRVAPAASAAVARRRAAPAAPAGPALRMGGGRTSRCCRSGGRARRSASDCSDCASWSSPASRWA